MRASVAIMIGVIGFLAAGCATSFTGEAHVEGGPSGCRAKCKAWGMDLTGMVAVGEYSDACICRVGKGTGGDESGAVGAAAVGVITQMREAEERQHMMTMMPVR